MSLLVAALATAAAPAPTSSRAERIDQVRAAVATQDYARATQLLTQADRDFPGDPEILRLLGSVQAYGRHYPQAIATLQRAASISPNDLDIRAALARAYLWSGDRASAAAEVAAMERADPGNAEAAAIRNQLAEAPAAPEAGRWGAAFAQGFSRVSFPSRPSRDWWNTTATLSGRLAEGTNLIFGAEREDRGTAVDTRLEARIDQSLGQHARGYIAVAGTPDADFREKWSLAGGAELDIASFATVLADLRHAEYRDASVTVFQPGLRLSARRLAVDVTVRMINLWDEEGVHRTGVSGRVDHMFSTGATLFAGAAVYPDTEAGITRQVHSYFLGGALPLSSSATLRLGVDYDRRSRTYERKGASVGVQFRF